MESSGWYGGQVHPGGVEEGKIGHSCDAKKKKSVTAVQLTEDRKIKHMYATQIEDFSERSSLNIFQSCQYVFPNSHRQVERI